MLHLLSDTPPPPPAAHTSLNSYALSALGLPTTPPRPAALACAKDSPASPRLFILAGPATPTSHPHAFAAGGISHSLHSGGGGSVVRASQGSAGEAGSSSQAGPQAVSDMAGGVAGGGGVFTGPASLPPRRGRASISGPTPDPDAVWPVLATPPSSACASLNASLTSAALAAGLRTAASTHTHTHTHTQSHTQHQHHAHAQGVRVESDGDGLVHSVFSPASPSASPAGSRPTSRAGRKRTPSTVAPSISNDNSVAAERASVSPCGGPSIDCNSKELAGAVGGGGGGRAGGLNVFAEENDEQQVGHMQWPQWCVCMCVCVCVCVCVLCCVVALCSYTSDIMVDCDVVLWLSL
jgi:hypothetical protein